MASRTVTLTVEGDTEAVLRAFASLADLSDALRAQTEQAIKIREQQYRVLADAIRDISDRSRKLGIPKDPPNPGL